MKILKTYPRKRPILPQEYCRIFKEEYLNNRYGESNLGKVVRHLESWMHKCVSSQSKCVLLELGAGTLNHIKYEETLSIYDIVEPSTYLLNQKMLHRIRTRYKSIAEIPLSPAYDRIISIAVLEHMLDLPTELARAGLLLKNGGIFQAGIPNEGSIIWRSAWGLTTALAFRMRTGLDYGKIMKHEHVNTAGEIIALTKHFFKTCRVKYFPLPFSALALYVHIEATNPKIDVATAWLANRRMEVND
jgi:hypothetical protein